MKVGGWDKPERVKRHSELLKKMWKDPDYRKKRIAAVSKSNSTRIWTEEQRKNHSKLYRLKNNSNWKGGRKVPRKVAFELYDLERKCSKCGSESRLHVHHKDKNHFNNMKSNLEILCTSCHARHHSTGRKKSQQEKISIASAQKLLWSKVRMTKGILIWFIGCDATGKTTAALYAEKTLKKIMKTKVNYLHYSKPDKDPEIFFKKVFEHLRRGESVVADRWWEGARIYSDVLGHGIPKAKHEDWEERMLARAEKHATFLVLCQDSPEAIAKRFKERGETFIGVKHITPVQNGFIRFANMVKKRGKIKVLKYVLSKNELTFL